ncbi:MAG: hypothetical protein FWE42_06155 [Defluviitaleaceae bacterium]|nr:hypothetical protein [Defluviitaleaceae bacterium]
MYWVCITLAAVLVFAIPIGMGIRNPHIQPPDSHGPPAALMREWNRMRAQDQRELGRLADFFVLVNHIYENYPYLELAAQRNNVNFIELAVAANTELTEVARHDISRDFFSNFANEHLLEHLGGFGGLRFSGEPRAMFGWITQPYFFNYYDWRFYDDRFEIPVLDDNLASEMLAEGVMYLRVNTFIPKGYELVSRNPYWYFCLDTDTQYLMDLYKNLDGVEDLVIDIRGISSGFRDYFVPLILAPNLREPVDTRFYAFHADVSFSNRVSREYRAWYGLGDTACKSTLVQDFEYDLPDSVALGFPIDVTVSPVLDLAFEGRIWLLTDSDNFSGPNLAYLQMARDAGFTIVYEENPESIGWDTSFIHLPHSGLSVRFNPLFFTDAAGRSFEETGPVYDYRLYPDLYEILGILP